MPNEMTFQQEGDYIVCYIDGVEVSRAKKAADGTSTAEVIDIINDQIKANPTLAGTEPNLEGLEVSGDKYAVPAQIPVVANPTLAGTEADLTGLEVDGTKYKVGGGGGVTLEDIVDSQGNKRFVEGDIDLVVTYPSLWESSYAKWSLSGTHLMIVGVLKNKDTSFANAPGDECFQFELPDYIMDKIYTVFGSYTVSIGSFWDGSAMKDSSLYKNKTTGKISFGTTGQIANNSTIRFQYDLLIDADYSE